MTQQPPYHSDDEISLRDLYLILRRGLPLILIVAVLAAAAVLTYLAVRGPRYEAEATVVVNPNPVRVQGERNLSLEQRNSITFETYERMAFSRGVLEDTLAQLDGLDDLSVGDISGNGSLERLAGPTNPDQVAPLTISHSFVWPDAEVAARIVDAWAAVTVDTVRSSLTASLEPVASATAQQLERTRERLTALENEWLVFQERDDSGFIEAQLNGLTTRVPATEERLAEIEREIAAVEGSRSALQELDPAVLSDEEAADALIQLQGEDLVDGEVVERAYQLLLQTNGDEGSLVALTRQIELQRLTSRLGGLQAQREAVAQQLEGLRQQEFDLRERLASLRIERDRLQAQLLTANTTLADLEALQPVLDYVGELAPANSRVLGPASVPTGATGPSRMLIAAIAAVVGAMLATLFVFLRAAVAEPSPSAPTGGRPSARGDADGVAGGVQGKGPAVH